MKSRFFTTCNIAVIREVLQNAGAMASSRSEYKIRYAKKLAYVLLRYVYYTLSSNSQGVAMKISTNRRNSPRFCPQNSLKKRTSLLNLFKGNVEKLKVDFSG